LLHRAIARTNLRDANAAVAIVDFVLDGAAAMDDIAVLVARIGGPDELAASPERQTVYNAD